jgi:hypothetical protein
MFQYRRLRSSRREKRYIKAALLFPRRPYSIQQSHHSAQTKPISPRALSKSISSPNYLYNMKTSAIAAALTALAGVASAGPVVFDVTVTFHGAADASYTRYIPADGSTVILST